MRNEATREEKRRTKEAGLGSGPRSLISWPQRNSEALGLEPALERVLDHSHTGHRFGEMFSFLGASVGTWKRIRAMWGGKNLKMIVEGQG